ncbi:MAG: nuclear transport factor 2 family protein [Alphaproteobacteria bacterium]|nr:nuclear transport factor 2 family protein [Alphaproteobacteria bacterium]
MSRAATERLINAYYDRFNAQDVEGFLALLSPGIVHDISQGGNEKGRAAFRAFLLHMNACYRERVGNLAVMTSPDGRRAAAEFDLAGTYLRTDGKLPTAKGQRYRLRVGAFFVVRRGRIARVSNHYNMRDWLRQVGAR